MYRHMFLWDLRSERDYNVKVSLNSCLLCHQPQVCSSGCVFTCGQVSQCVVGEGLQCCSNIHTEDTGTLHFPRCSWCDLGDAADVFAPSAAQPQSTWNTHTQFNNYHFVVPESMFYTYAPAVLHLCQQLACMMCPQLAVWIPRDRSGCMNRGSWCSKTHSHTSKSTPILTDCCSDDIMMLPLPGSGRLRWRFLDKTVDLCTNAANTIALPWLLTSCSSWHRIQVTSSRRSAPPTRLGPTHVCETEDGSELGGLEEEREEKWEGKRIVYDAVTSIKSWTLVTADSIRVSLFPPDVPGTRSSRCGGLQLLETLLEQFFVLVDEVFLHLRHLSHDLFSPESSHFCLSLPLRLVFVSHHLMPKDQCQRSPIINHKVESEDSTSSGPCSWLMGAADVEAVRSLIVLIFDTIYNKNVDQVLSRISGSQPIDICCFLTDV